MGCMGTLRYLQNFSVNLKLFLKNLSLKMPEIFEGRVIFLL